MRYMVLTGRQHKLCLAELISLYPDVEDIGTGAIVSTHPDIARLGGAIKVAELLGEVPPLEDDILSRLAEELPQSVSGKLTFGISVYGNSTLFAERLALNLKKRLSPRSLRAVYSKNSQVLNAAQVHYNQLTTKGIEIVIVIHRNRAYLGKTLAVQDINAYTARDHDRPGRNAKVGMLPPKLAQIMINLAHPQPNATILDPFCGTGVVLQEALLMGFDALGADIDQEILQLSEQNLLKLKTDHPSIGNFQLKLADATTASYAQPIDAVVTEGYLGPPLTSPPTTQQLESLAAKQTKLYRDFLRNLRQSLSVNAPVILCQPAWIKNGRWHSISLIDQLPGLGYNLQTFSAITSEDLRYYRPGQFVARDIIILRSI